MTFSTGWARKYTHVIQMSLWFVVLEAFRFHDEGDHQRLFFAFQFCFGDLDLPTSLTLSRQFS